MPVIPPPGDHGGDAEAIAAALGVDPSTVLDLSMSMNPCAPDVRAVLTRHLDGAIRYPDATRATAALADAMGVDPRRLLLTNGGSEAIALVCGHLGEADVRAPEFSLYERHLRAVRPGAPRIRSNPNNPTGSLVGAGERADVWDEAFFPLATGEWTRGDGRWVLGSLTKLLACPGLRVGYVIGDDVGALRAPRWSVNGIACSALPELLEDVDLHAWSEAIAVLRGQLVDVLAGLPVRPSDAPWVLVDAPLRDWLAPHGIVVRDCASFGLPGVTRIAVPDEHGLERLAAALR